MEDKDTDGSGISRTSGCLLVLQHQEICSGETAGEIDQQQKTKSVVRFDPLTQSKELSYGEVMNVELEKRGIARPLDIIIEEGGTIIFNENNDVFIEEVKR